MSEKLPAFRVIDGRSGDIPADRAALSLVHASGRIDIAVSHVLCIEARNEANYTWGQRTCTSRQPFVEISLAREVRERLYRMTRDIVGSPLDVVVDGKSIARPVIREPLGRLAWLRISAYDFGEVNALADELRTRWKITRPQPIS